MVSGDINVTGLLVRDSCFTRDCGSLTRTWHAYCRQFEHENVVQMHGVVTAGFPYLLVLEVRVLVSVFSS
jgi:hypothetical protein